MARLGLADLLGKSPADAEELARHTKTHAPLKRVLRLLVAAGVVMEDERGQFALTAIGSCLRTGMPGSMRAVALLFGGIFTVSRLASRLSAGCSAKTRLAISQSIRKRPPTSMPP